MKIKPNFGELLTLPITHLKKREGQPFLQGTARNIGHASFGDEAANKFEQRYLGDTPQGFAKPGGSSPTIPPLATLGQPEMLPTQPELMTGDPETMDQARMWLQLFNLQG